MVTQRVAVSLAEDLVAEIDKAVGIEGRSTFLADVAREALRRRSGLIEWLSRDEPVWRDEDHPDLATMGPNAWVRQLRQEWGKRPVLNAVLPMRQGPPAWDDLDDGQR